MPVAATFHALADPTRLAVVTQLGRGDATIGELAAAHAMSLPAFTKHISVLVDAGVVRRQKLGRSVRCSLTPARLAEAERWLGDLGHFWTTNLDRLDDLLTKDPS